MQIKSFNRSLGLAAALVAFGLAACGDETEAQRKGVGAECATDDDCAETAPTCLDFKGGYCGVDDCTADADCPAGSACVTHSDGVNYCFLICDSKADCNVNRTVDNEANCASNVTFVETRTDKACVPPSGN
jgi:hypothetical protein